MLIAFRGMKRDGFTAREAARRLHKAADVYSSWGDQRRA